MRSKKGLTGGKRDEREMEKNMLDFLPRDASSVFESEGLILVVVVVILSKINSICWSDK